MLRAMSEEEFVEEEPTTTTAEEEEDVDVDLTGEIDIDHLEITLDTVDLMDMILEGKASPEDLKKLSEERARISAAKTTRRRRRRRR